MFEINGVLILLTIISVSISIAAVALVWLTRREIKRLQSNTNKQLRMTSSSVVGMGNRLLELERRISGLRDDQRALSDTQQDLAYSKAKKLALQDLSTDAIVASTGLSHSEIDLIKLIQSQQSTLPDPVS